MSWKISAVSPFLLLTLVVCLCQFSAASTPACINPPSSLVSWWTGDTDESDLYGKNNPSAVNNITLVPAEVLDGFSFATGSYIDIPASKSLANQKFTWDAWVEPDGPGPNNDEYGSVIVQQDFDISDGISLWWSAIDDHFRFAFGNIYSELIATNDTFPAGSFYFVAATYDGGTFRLYVNGVLEGTYAEKKTILYSSNTWNIGSTNAYYRGEGDARTWNGIIDEVQAYKAALSATQIAALYKAGSLGNCKAPVLVSPTSASFASQTVGTTSAPKTITVMNNRNATLTLDGFSFTGTDFSDFAESSTTCASTLAARKSCKVGVTFTPQAIGKRAAVLDVNDSAVGSPQTVNLKGTGK